MADYKPGGDQKAIHRIVKENYGDLKTLFSQHHWEWRGSRSMAEVATLIKEEYGSIKTFESTHHMKNDTIHDQLYGSLESNFLAGNVWLVGYEVGLESTWEPEHWGVDGFTERADAEEFLGQSRNGAIFVCYDTTADNKRILGIYQYDTTEYVDHKNHMSEKAFSSLSAGEQSSWRYAFRAVRCWNAPKSSKLNAEDIFPDAYKKSLNFDAANIVGIKNLDTLRSTRWIETPFFKGLNLEDPFENDPDVLITSFWGWDPETWGCVGFTNKSYLSTLKDKTSPPFLMLVYVSETAKGDSPYKGKVTGFYELSHEIGHKSEFIAPHQLSNPNHPNGAWAHSFKALRAWSIPDEYMPDIRDFYPEVYSDKLYRAISTWAKELPARQIALLKSLPVVEVPVYGRDAPVDLIIRNIFTGPGRVSGGNFRSGGYEVTEPTDTEKELYMFELDGVIENFVSNVTAGQKIIKLGLSIYPETRRRTFNKTLLNGSITMPLRTTCTDEAVQEESRIPYSSFKIALAGEDAMKDFLAEKHQDSSDATRHLGGEFYLTDEVSIDLAWTIGRQAALEAEGQANG